jgi:hypothetical protein
LVNPSSARRDFQGPAVLVSPISSAQVSVDVPRRKSLLNETAEDLHVDPEAITVLRRGAISMHRS